jgi:hypothetical protein
MLESNAGYTQLHRLLLAARERSRISAEEAQRVLKDVVFAHWIGDECESRADTLKTVGRRKLVRMGCVTSCVTLETVGG